VAEIYQSLCRFLPRLTRTAFEEELNNLDITAAPLPHTADGMERSVTCRTLFYIFSLFLVQYFGMVVIVNLYLQVFQHVNLRVSLLFFFFGALMLLVE